MALALKLFLAGSSTGGNLNVNEERAALSTMLYVVVIWLTGFGLYDELKVFDIPAGQEYSPGVLN